MTNINLELLQKGYAEFYEFEPNALVFKKQWQAAGKVGTRSPAAVSRTVAVIKVFTGVIAGGVLGESSELVSRPADLIESLVDLQLAAQTNLAAFLTAMPGRLVYELKLVTSLINRDGVGIYGTRNQVITGYKKDGTPRYRSVTNRFAVLDIYVVKKGGTRTKLDSINLGPTDAVKLNPTGLQLQTANLALKQESTTTNINEIAGIQTDQEVAQIPTYQPPPEPAPGTTPGGSTAQTPVQAPAPPPTLPSIPAGLFAQAEPYKFSNSPAVYIYDNGRLRGVATETGFARYFGRDWDRITPLEQIHAIRPMPDLSAYSVPAGFFDGTVIE